MTQETKGRLLLGGVFLFVLWGLALKAVSFKMASQDDPVRIEFTPHRADNRMTINVASLKLIGKSGKAYSLRNRLSSRPQVFLQIGKNRRSLGSFSYG